MGLELNVAVGYQFWLGKGPWTSSGGEALRVSVGARVPWPISFGLTLIDVSADFGAKDTSAVLTLSPGLYVRGHTQKFRKKNVIDVWGGAGFVPFSMGIASFHRNATTEQRLAGVSATDIKQSVANNLDVGRVVTRQSINVPLELGATYYISRGVGISLDLAFTFWIPRQLCYHDSDDHYCISDGLKSNYSLFAGAGVSFLP
jgi:hypothetical protein